MNLLRLRTLRLQCHLQQSRPFMIHRNLQQPYPQWPFPESSLPGLLDSLDAIGCEAVPAIRDFRNYYTELRPLAKITILALS